MNTDIIQGSTNYIDLDVTKELENRDFDVFAKESNKDNDNTCSTKRSKLSTVSDNNPAFNSNMSELQDSQSDYAQSPQLGQRGATRNVCCKRLCTTAPIGLAGAASTVSATLESANLEEA
jgi:hypothetical protein